jgi:D-alanyl-D-alanine carboxypeptidase/D-alanyl-D-alanine-endopeptidase (penicillin-binding protein 4)
MRRLILALPCLAFAAPSSAADARAVTAPPTVLAALRHAGLPASSLGLFARAVQGPDALAAFNEERSYVLASTTKVVTSLAALDLLGPQYRWRTYAFAKGEIVGGRLAGDLLIVGGGNAQLSSDDLRQWFAQMREQGLREIGGNIVLDRFAFALAEGDHVHTPKPSSDRPHHVWPDALTLNEGVVHIDVQPTRGRRADIRVDPPLAGVQLINNVAMGGGCAAYASMKSSGGTLRLVVSGSWSAGCGTRSIQFAPLSHSELTTHAVAAEWTQAGGVLRGRVIDNAVSGGSAVLQRDAGGELMVPFSVHLSPRLPQMLYEMNKSSDNMAARNLMLTLSPSFPIKAATLAGARARVADWLRAQGLADDDIEIDNGSGLSHTERGKPRAMVQLLCNAWRGRSAQAFVDSLPIAGVDGTLARRMQHGMATGHAFLKTGTLRETRALAGYVKARSGTVYAVAAMVNHPGAARATPALDALIEWVARNG